LTFFKFKLTPGKVLSAACLVVWLATLEVRKASAVAAPIPQTIPTIQVNSASSISRASSSKGFSAGLPRSAIKGVLIHAIYLFQAHEERRESREICQEMDRRSYDRSSLSSRSKRSSLLLKKSFSFCNSRQSSVEPNEQSLVRPNDDLCLAIPLPSSGPSWGVSNRYLPRQKTKRLYFPLRHKKKFGL